MRSRNQRGAASGPTGPPRFASVTPALAVALPLAVALLATACLPKFGELELDPEEPRRYFLPVVASTFSIADALGDNDFNGTLTVDSDGAYVLAQGDTVIEQAVLEAIELPEIAVPIGDTNVVIDFDVLGIPVPISRLDFAAAELEVILANPFSEPVDITLSTPNFVRDRESLSITTSIPAGGTLQQSLDYGGGSFVIGEDNVVAARYDARLPDGRRVRLGAGAFRLASFTPSLVVGNATDISLPLGRFPIATDFLEDFAPGQARVREASIGLTVVSEVTADASARATATFAVLRDSSRFDFVTPFADGVALAPAPPGGSARTELLLDGNNSDLIAALLQFPDSVVFEIDATLNPGPPVRPFRVEAGDSVRLAYEARVPLAVEFEGFAQVDTFLLPALGDLERVSAAALSIVTENGIPLGATVSAALLDEDGDPTSELLVGATTVLRPAVYDVDAGRVSDPRRDTVVVAVAPAAIPLLQTASRAALRVALDTDADAGFVQLRPDQSLTLEVGLEVTVERQR